MKLSTETRQLVVLAGCIPLALVAVLLMKYVWAAQVFGYPVVAVLLFVAYLWVTLPWVFERRR